MAQGNTTMPRKRNYSTYTALASLMLAVSGLAVRAQGHLYSDQVEYLAEVASNEFLKHALIEPSISIAGNVVEGDRDAIKSFADAFLWTTGVRTGLLVQKMAMMNVVYVNDFSQKDAIDIQDEFSKKIYEENFKVVQSAGHCGRINFTDKGDGSKGFILYIDRSAGDDQRLSCLYINYRSLFGIKSTASMRKFSDTFVADLRALRCKYAHSSAESMMDLFRSGRC